MRGRRPDAVSQDAKGNPGKRKRKVPIADRVRQLADAPASSSDPLAPPAVFGVEEFDGAVKIWREFAPVLNKRNIMDRLDRHTLAMFCYYLDRWWTAAIEIAKHGETQRVKTVAGGYMLRDHPAVRRRDEAHKFVMDLSKSFGFTPMDRHKLIREMVGTGAPSGGLFGDNPPQEQAASATDEPDDIVGFAARMSSAAPRPH